MSVGFSTLKNLYGPSTPLVARSREENAKWCGVDRCKVVALVSFVAISAIMLTVFFVFFRDEKHQGDHTT